MESVIILFKGAKLLRKSVLGQIPWEFQGSLNNFHMPNDLKTFLRWWLIGPSLVLQDEFRDESINSQVNMHDWR